MKHLKVITWARWRVNDSYAREFYTVFTASVLKPNFEYPLATVSMSIVKGSRRMFLTFANLDGLKAVFVVPVAYLDRLESAYTEAIRETEAIIAKQQTLHKMANLAPGGQIVRTDTGEVIAEAERYLREARGVDGH